MTLDELRVQIDAIDKEMASLFEKRMEVAGKIGRFKAKKGLDFYDEAREEAVLAKNVQYIQDPVIREYYRGFLEDLIELSRDYQEEICE